MDNEVVVYIYNGIYSVMKNEEILPFVTTWMDLEGITLNEISWTETDKCYMISLICWIWKKAEGGGERELEEGDQKVRISGYKYEGYNVGHDDYS